MSFLCHKNATIDCGNKRVLFPNDVVVQCHDRQRRANCLVLSPTKFARLMRRSVRHKKGNQTQFWVGQPSTQPSIFANEEVDSVSTGFGDDFTNRLKGLLNEFPELINPWTSLPPLRGEFDHHIDLTGHVRRQRMNRLSRAEKAELVRQCQEYISMNHIRPRTSSHAAHVLFARK